MTFELGITNLGFIVSLHIREREGDMITMGQDVDYKKSGMCQKAEKNRGIFSLKTVGGNHRLQNGQVSPRNEHGVLQ